MSHATRLYVERKKFKMREKIGCHFLKIERADVTAAHFSATNIDAQFDTTFEN